MTLPDTTRMELADEIDTALGAFLHALSPTRTAELKAELQQILWDNKTGIVSALRQPIASDAETVREEIARIVDPEAFSTPKEFWDCEPYDRRAARDKAFDKADAILSTSARASDAGAVREDERRRILLNLAITLLPDHSDIYERVVSNIETLPLIPALSTSAGAGTKVGQQRPQIDSSRVAESANAKSGIANG